MLYPESELVPHPEFVGETSAGERAIMLGGELWYAGMAEIAVKFSWGERRTGQEARLGSEHPS